MRRNLLYNIEKLHQTTTDSVKPLSNARLYNIEKLHQTTTESSEENLSDCCIILKNYIKPQQYHFHWNCSKCCIILKNYIKPQLLCPNRGWYRGLYNIEKLHQTTTLLRDVLSVFQLYNIEKLHQTTTAGGVAFIPPWLYNIEKLHQTTTINKHFYLFFRCIILKNYIKPQPSVETVIPSPVV